MKTVYRFATLTLMGLAVFAGVFSQQAAAAAKAENLVRGVVGPVTNNTSWSGFSALSLIPGAALIPVTSTTSVFYLGFTAGTTVDISNMVLYTTARGSSTITAVTPAKLGGITNPNINPPRATVGPVIEISTFNPCIVRLDPTKITLSALSDYYLVVYFTGSDTNNQSIGLTTPSFPQSSLRGSYFNGDDSRLSVGGAIPSTLNFSSEPYMLMYVMTN